MILGD